MSAQIIRLDDLRTVRRGTPVPAERPEVAQLPLVVQAHPEAVALHLPDVEFWLSPAQAREIAADLVRAAADAEREGERG